MAKRKLENKLVRKEEINEELKLIEESYTDYITPTGKVYKLYEKDKYYPKKVYIDKNNGYVYTNITCKDGKNKKRRLHRLIAIAYIHNPKPDTFNVVGHKDNNKANFNLNNLYWTTTSENTQKAYDDQLAKNDMGIKDSQSKPIAVYRNDGKLLSVYGSIKEAGRNIEGYSASGIAQVVDRIAKGRKGCYFKSITKEEYINFLGKKSLKFSIKNLNKM